MSSSRFHRHPAPTHRRAQPDANTARRQWRALAEDAVALAAGAGDGHVEGCATWSEPLHFRMALKMLPEFPAPFGDGLAKAIAASFRAACEAMLCAGTPQRRAIAAPVLAAGARAVEQLLEDVVAAELALSRRISGDNEEDD